MSQLLSTGKCGATFGLKGAVKLITDNTADNLKRAGVLSLSKNGATFSLSVEDVWPQGSNLYIKFKGIDTKEEASKVLTGALVYIERQYACPLSPEEVYCSDLVGLNVLYQGQKVGQVASWLEAAGSLMLEIKTDDLKNHIVPYQKVFFSQPDLSSGTIDILNREILV